jgi:hypothetical protein
VLALGWPAEAPAADGPSAPKPAVYHQYFDGTWDEPLRGNVGG